jgi:hydroxypyruvate reductase
MTTICTEVKILANPALSDLARMIFTQALADCSIERAMAEKIKRIARPGETDALVFRESVLEMSRFSQVRIVSIGKAGAALLDAMLARLPLAPQCEVAGVLIAPLAPAPLPDGFEFFAGGHPFPNEDSFAGARAVLQLLQAAASSPTAGRDTLCMFLISGGASAMMELPLDPNISLTDTEQFNRALVHSGASITEINCVRKHFSAVKGGRLALAAGRATCLSVLVSDVPPGRLETISSGPTLPDPSTVEECHGVLRRYNLLESFPASVRQYFSSLSLPETPKPELLTALTWTLLDAHDLAEAAHRHAERLGFHATIDNTCDDWDYRAAAEYLLARFRSLRREREPGCLISVGELAVALPSHANGHIDDRDDPRIGGRNQHFALYAATLLSPSDEPVAILSAGSDGIDGNSAAAGAVVTGQTLHEAKADGASQSGRVRMEAETALGNFCSSTYLEGTGSTIKTGPTGNNLRDLRIFLSEPIPNEESEDHRAG